MKKHIISSLLVLFWLSACGGGGTSSSDNTGQNTDNIIISTPDTPDTPEGPFTLKLKVVNKNLCGDSTPNLKSRLVIHNEDFTTKEILYPSETGEFTYESNDEKVNISVAYVMHDRFEEGKFSLNIETIMAQPLVDLGTLISNTYDQGSCECMTSDFVINSDLDVTPDSKVYLNGKRYTNVVADVDKILVNEYQVCRSPGSQWPSLTSVIDTEENGSILAYDDSFQGGENQHANILGEALYVNVENRDSFSDVVISSLGYQQDVMAWHNYNESDQLITYPVEQIDRRVVEGAPILKISDFDGMSYTFAGLRTSNTIDNSQRTVNMSLPNLSPEELKVFFDNETMTYDSAKFQDFDYLLLAAGSNDLVWTITTELTGTLPDVSNIDLSSVANELLDIDFYQFMHNGMQVSVLLDSYSGVTGYDDYVRHWTQRDNHEDPRWDNNTFMYVGGYVDFNVLFSPLSQYAFEVSSGNGINSLNRGFNKAVMKRESNKWLKQLKPGS